LKGIEIMYTKTIKNIKKEIKMLILQLAPNAKVKDIKKIFKLVNNEKNVACLVELLTDLRIFTEIKMLNNLVLYFSNENILWNYDFM